ncbi:MAG: serine/threonine protein kinase [Planctomycetota bacterium]|nr:serine/threonine protein kinase [Planctomycetota bacterium]
MSIVPAPTPDATPDRTATPPPIPALAGGSDVLQYVARLRILRKIADGGMGTVYLAEQLGEKLFKKIVAVKVIKEDRLQDRRALQMFLDEARLVADLVHPNIAQVYNLGRVGNLYFIVMEFLHGRTLTDYLNRHREMGVQAPHEMSAFIVSRVCRGLEYAHTKRDIYGRHLGIVHRDVTPSNIMIDFRGAVKLTDFGIAKALTMNMPDETKVIMGKLPYMSPEQASGGGTDARSDIFSLGLVLYESITMTRVYAPKTRAELVEMMTRFRIKDPRRIVPAIPAELAAITMKALERRPEDRFQTAFEFGDALERYMYSKGYGPTNEKLARYLLEIYPGADRDRVG